MLTKVSRTFRFDLELSKKLDSICVRHGDKTFHIEQALSAYLADYAPFKAPDKPVPVKAKKPAKRFVKPTIKQLEDHFFEKGSMTCVDDAQAFYDFYESKGWVVGKSAMKNWKAAVNNWMRGKKNENNQSGTAKGPAKRTAQRDRLADDRAALSKFATGANGADGGCVVVDGNDVRPLLDYPMGSDAG